MTNFYDDPLDDPEGLYDRLSEHVDTIIDRIYNTERTQWEVDEESE